MKMIHRVKTGLWDGAAMMRNLLSLTIALLLLGNVAASQGEKDPGGTSADLAPRDGSGYAVPIVMAAYDTSGNLGVGFIGGQGIGEVCYTLDNFPISRCVKGISILSSISSNYAFEPFTFTNDIPFYGKLWGKGLITITEPVHYVIPVDKDVAQISEMETNPIPNNRSEISFLPYLLDTLSGPSIGITTTTTQPLLGPFSSAGANLTVEYLDEPNKSQYGTMTFRFKQGDLSRLAPSLIWGTDSIVRPFVRSIPEINDVGTIRLTFQSDGYTTDTVTLKPLPGVGVIWRPGQVTLGEKPSASDLLPNDYFIREDNPGSEPDGILINDNSSDTEDNNNFQMPTPIDGPVRALTILAQEFIPGLGSEKNRTPLGVPQSPR